MNMEGCAIRERGQSAGIKAGQGNKNGVVAEHKNLQQPFYDAYESKNERKKGKANTTC